MVFKVTWYNTNKTVVLQQYEGEATKDDLYEMAKESARLLNSVSHKVHLIVDERKMDNVLNTSDMRFLDKLVPPNQGAVVVLVPDHRLRYKEVIHNMGNKIAPKAFVDETIFASTLEEARHYLKEAHNIEFDDTSVE
ncbi:MAG: hypothetical protein KC708_16955 [Anaerolineae bacterium]|nr:hypothetical protein [Anaerolineae bacterium]